MNPEERQLLTLSVHRARGLRSHEKERLVEHFDTIDRFVRCSLDDIAKIVGRRLRFSAWTPKEAFSAAIRDLDACRLLGIDIVPIWSAAYPPLLREVWDAPFLLFVRGSLADPGTPAVAVVGTRNPDTAGTDAAFRFAVECRKLGIPLVSGLAAGIDGAAHRGAVEHALEYPVDRGTVYAKGRDSSGATSCPTIAVLGSGIDTIYPAANRPLAESILECGGAVLSEYPPGEPPRRWHFPERNRIIAGLVRWVLIVQAPQRSGALITADYALDCGRELVVHRAGTNADEAGHRDGRERRPDGPSVGHADGTAFRAGTQALADDGAAVVDSPYALVEAHRSGASFGSGVELASRDASGGERRTPPGERRTPPGERRTPPGERRTPPGARHSADVKTILARKLELELDFEPASEVVDG